MHASVGRRHRLRSRRRRGLCLWRLLLRLDQGLDRAQRQGRGGRRCDHGRGRQGRAVPGRCCQARSGRAHVRRDRRQARSARRARQQCGRRADPRPARGHEARAPDRDLRGQRVRPLLLLAGRGAPDVDAPRRQGRRDRQRLIGGRPQWRSRRLHRLRSLEGRRRHHHDRARQGGRRRGHPGQCRTPWRHRDRHDPACPRAMPRVASSGDARPAPCWCRVDRWPSLAFQSRAAAQDSTTAPQGVSRGGECGRPGAALRPTRRPPTTSGEQTGREAPPSL